MAEALITLGVIGVVSALTIPNLYINHQKRVTEERLKFAYAKLNEALQISEYENGEFKYWNFDQPNSDLFEKNIAKYMQVVSKQKRSKLSYKEISGNNETGILMVRSNVTIFETSNGVHYITLDAKLTSSLEIMIDINGYNPPNQFGKDAFYVSIDKSHPEEVYFLGTYSTSEYTFTKDPNSDRDVLLGKKAPKKGSYKYQCNKQSRGMWCGRLIQIDEWKIKKDYPW